MATPQQAFWGTNVTQCDVCAKKTWLVEVIVGYGPNGNRTTAPCPSGWSAVLTMLWTCTTCGARKECVPLP